MMMLYGSIRIFASLVFLYLLWRKLHEDYNSEELLTYSWLFLLAFLTGGRIVFGIVNWGVWNDSIWDWFSVFTKPGFDYLGAVVAGTIQTVFYANSRDWKIWNILEDMTVPVMAYLTVLLTGELVMANFNMETAYWLVAVIVTGMGTVAFKNKYRSFVWYPSGKKGFLFLMANIIFGLLATAIILWHRLNPWMGGLMISWSLISLVGLVILGGMEIKLKVFQK